MSETILVTGATGNVGREVIASLLALRDGHQFTGRVVAAVRETSVGSVPCGADEARVFAFGKVETNAAALDGVSRLFLLRPPQIANVARDMFPVVDCARQAGVQQIVFLSLLGVEKQSFVPHHKVERYLQASGVPWTFLRPSFFMQNLSTTHRQEILEENEILVPVGKGKTSFVDVRDIGAVAAQVLTQPGHLGEAYELTGSEALDYYQVASLFTEILGRPITYRNPSLLRFIRTQRTQGRPLPFVLVMAGLYTATRFGSGQRVTGEVERLLGRPPITMRQFIRDHASTWRHDENPRSRQAYAP